MLKRILRRCEAMQGYSIRRRRLDLDLAALDPWMAGRVLEVGAGKSPRRGRFVPPERQAVSWVQLDLSLAMRPDIVSDASALPFAAQAFDCLVCLEVLEYAKDPVQIMAEFHRVAAIDAVLILSTPFLHRQDSPQDRWRFTRSGLTVLLEAGGWGVVDIREQGAALDVVANILLYVSRQPKSLAGRLAACLLLPLIFGLARLDKSLSCRFPQLTSFCTGYVFMAKRKE